MQTGFDDLGALDALLADADREFADALMAQLDQDMERLHLALMRGADLLGPGRVADFLSLRRDLHEMKGLALTIGADALQQVCARGEMLALGHEAAELAALLPRAIALSAIVRTDLAARQGRSAA